MGISPQTVQNQPKSSSPHSSFLSCLRPRYSHDIAKQDWQNANTAISSVILRPEQDFRPLQSLSSGGAETKQTAVTSNIIKSLNMGKLGSASVTHI